MQETSCQRLHKEIIYIRTATEDNILSNKTWQNNGRSIRSMLKVYTFMILPRKLYRSQKFIFQAACYLQEHNQSPTNELGDNVTLCLHFTTGFFFEN